MKANYLVCYDIKDEKRLAKVYKTLSGLGIHLQYSVFYCKFDWEQLMRIKEILKELINEKEDDVRIYPLPEKTKVLALGAGYIIPDGIKVILNENSIS